MKKRSTVPKKVNIQCKLLCYLFSALCYLEIALLLVNQIQKSMLNHTKSFRCLYTMLVIKKLNKTTKLVNRP